MNAVDAGVTQHVIPTGGAQEFMRETLQPPPRLAPKCLKTLSPANGTAIARAS